MPISLWRRPLPFSKEKAWGRGCTYIAFYTLQSTIFCVSFVFLPVCSAVHPIISRAETSANNNSNLGNLCAWHGRHHFGAIFSDATSLVIFTNHKTWKNKSQVPKHEIWPSTLLSEVSVTISWPHQYYCKGFSFVLDILLRKIYIARNATGQ